MILNVPSQEQVDQVAASLAPDVVRIRIREGLDWSDHEALFVYIVLADAASRPPRLHKIAKEVMDRIEHDLDLGDQKFLVFPSFRSESEQRELKDKLWD